MITKIISENIKELQSSSATSSALPPYVESLESVPMMEPSPKYFAELTTDIIEEKSKKLHSNVVFWKIVVDH